MGQCYAFHLSRILTSVDTFIINTFLLLYVHFSFDAVFIKLHLLDKSTKTCNICGCAGTQRNISHFPLAYKTLHPKYIHFGRKIGYNTVKLEPSPRLETGNFFFSLFAVYFFSFLCYNCQNYLVLIIYFFSEI